MTSPALLEWLLELEGPSARYLTFRYLLARPEGDQDAIAARAAIDRSPPARHAQRAIPERLLDQARSRIQPPVQGQRNDVVNVSLSQRKGIKRSLGCILVL
jgi:hypothetical protein